MMGTEISTQCFGTPSPVFLQRGLWSGSGGVRAGTLLRGDAVSCTSGRDPPCIYIFSGRVVTDPTTGHPGPETLYCRLSPRVKEPPLSSI